MAGATATTITDQLDPFVRLRDLQAVVGLSRTHIWRLRREGDFPEPVQITPTIIGWRLSAVRAWMDARPLATEATK